MDDNPDPMEQGEGEEEDMLEDEDGVKNSQRLKAIQQLISMKKQSKNKNMKARVSNSFINQFLIMSLINK
jgi:hypothetical protein